LEWDSLLQVAEVDGWVADLPPSSGSWESRLSAMQAGAVHWSKEAARRVASADEVHAAQMLGGLPFELEAEIWGRFSSAERKRILRSFSFSERVVRIGEVRVVERRGKWYVLQDQAWRKDEKLLSEVLFEVRRIWRSPKPWETGLDRTSWAEILIRRRKKKALVRVSWGRFRRNAVDYLKDFAIQKGWGPVEIYEGNRGVSVLSAGLALHPVGAIRSFPVGWNRNLLQWEFRRGVFPLGSPYRPRVRPYPGDRTADHVGIPSSGGPELLGGLLGSSSDEHAQYRVGAVLGVTAAALARVLSDVLSEPPTRLLVDRSATSWLVEILWQACGFPPSRRLAPSWRVWAEVGDFHNLPALRKARWGLTAASPPPEGFFPTENLSVCEDAAHRLFAESLDSLMRSSLVDLEDGDDDLFFRVLAWLERRCAPAFPHGPPARVFDRNRSSGPSAYS
jgi:hypothetical protein